ncbi:UNKNOWN [Stylonychia lemnae]|uniref:Phosphoglycerate mutase family protein n=1 Tax=Stylonychia lemnae TaxID=5949 RepID=A0A078AWH8_STYLE|nr:UNKNOWN [Stylonychia lemnae]|eukprot:CDW86509.1 UNKNOWN [Stylonychia lemnae]
MEDLQELIERLNIKLRQDSIPDEDLKNTSFIIIRHGYSEYNYRDQVITDQHGVDSDAFRQLKVDKTLTDPGLHQIGVLQCESNQDNINRINFKVVFVSPMQRAIQTAINMFKKHPNLQNIKFIILPIAREVLETSNDVSPDIEKIVEKYSPGQSICEGLNFNFSMVYLYGIPRLWQIYTFSNLEKQKDMIKNLRKDESGEINNVDVIIERLGAHNPRYETHSDLFKRAQIIKTFMREYLISHPLDHSSQEKYGLVSHSRIMATLTASGVNEKEELLDYYWLQNCEMRAFTDF